MTTINHYGKWIDSVTPTTGVLNSNSIAWEWITDEQCLTCEEIMQDIESDENLTDEQKQDELDFCECDSAHTKIIGDAWSYDTKTKQYSVITDNPELEFAAIVRETVIQVVWSKYIAKGSPCSPCYPGQIDLDSIGEFLAYTLPDYLLGKE